MSSSTYTAKIMSNVTEFCADCTGEYTMTAPAEKTVADIKADWNACKAALGAADDETDNFAVISEMTKLGYEFEEKNVWEEITLGV